MREIIESAVRNLNESSLSRLWAHNEDHECGAITAFRDKKADGTPYTKKENNARNKSLLAKLMSKGYGVTKIGGSYQYDDGTVSKERSFFVVDKDDTGNLVSDFKRIGKEFDQESVLIAPKGAINGETDAYLLGTIKSDFLGVGQKFKVGKGRLGKASGVAISYVGGRPFVFEEVGDEVAPPNTNNGRWTVDLFSKKHWTELIEDDDD